VPPSQVERTRQLQPTELDKLRQLCVKEHAEQPKLREEQLKREKKAALPSPRLGMTVKQVLENTHMGTPMKVNRSVGSYGVHEQWVYGGWGVPLLRERPSHQLARVKPRAQGQGGGHMRGLARDVGESNEDKVLESLRSFALPMQ
jgi:hypothetical protein